MTPLVSAVLVWSALAGQYVPDYGDYLRDADLQAASLQRYWQTKLPLPAGDAVTTATLVDSRLYLTTKLGNVVALQAQSGMTAWARNVSTGLIPVYPPTHVSVSPDRLLTVVLTEREAHLLDRETGQPVAQFRLPFNAGTSAVGADDLLYAGSTDGHMYALRWDTYNGGRAYQHWRVRTGGPIRSAPILDGEDLIFASSDGRVHCCQAYNRALNWSMRTDGPIAAALVLDESGVYVASGDRSLYRLDSFAGTKTWQQRLEVPLRNAPAVAGRTVYQYAPGLGLFAIDVDSGAIRWRRPEMTAFLARRGDETYALSGDGLHLCVLDDGTGQPRRSMEVYGTSVFALNTRDDAIYLVSATNQVACLRPADVTYLSLAELAVIRSKAQKSGELEAATVAPAAPSGSKEDRSVYDDPLRSRSPLAPLAGD